MCGGRGKRDLSGVCRQFSGRWDGLGRDGRRGRVVHEQRRDRRLRAPREARRGRGGADRRHDGVHGRDGGGGGHARHHQPQGPRERHARHCGERRDVLDPDAARRRPGRPSLHGARHDDFGEGRGQQGRDPLHADERWRLRRQHVQQDHARGRRNHRGREPLGNVQQHLPAGSRRAYAHARRRQPLDDL